MKKVIQMATTCDGRKKSERAPREAFHCTACSQRMPNNRRKWGLVWESKIHGICISCLEQIRGSAGRRYLESLDNPTSYDLDASSADGVAEQPT
jgi:ribosomal protein S26